MCLPTMFGSDLQLWSVVTQQWKRKAPAVCTTTINYIIAVYYYSVVVPLLRCTSKKCYEYVGCELDRL